MWAKYTLTGKTRHRIVTVGSWFTGKRELVVLQVEVSVDDGLRRIGYYMYHRPEIFWRDATQDDMEIITK